MELPLCWLYSSAGVGVCGEFDPEDADVMEASSSVPSAAAGLLTLMLLRLV